MSEVLDGVLDVDALPEPKGFPIVGHLHQLRQQGMVQRVLGAMQEVQGGIFKLRLGRRLAVFVTSADLVAELCDETRFRKVLGPGLRVVRRFGGDGLFTALGDEPNWAKAHRILLPAFSQRAMRGYYGVMQEVCDQLIAKWERSSGTEVMVANDMTRLTLDSIAVAGFGHHFRTFERQELDPFLVALEGALTASRATVMRLPLQARFAGRQDRQFQADIDTMNGMVDAIIAERRRQPTDAHDLLNLMLTAVDPETHEGLDDVNIRYQVLTFLIAGHETTSGLLTFVFHLLLRHPYVLAQAYAEVDRVLLAGERLEYHHLAQLTIVDRIIKEAQRLWPTAPAIGVGPYQDEIIGGRWRIPKNRQVSIFIPGLHRDPAVWDRPDEFDIDRWLPEAEAARHPHAYKPFGNGARACIGRQFALVEAKMAIAMILQRFVISDPANYRLSLKETLTIKPDHFTMRVELRQPHERFAQAAAASEESSAVKATAVAGAGLSLAVLYGSSLGTARDIAEEIAARARADGFDAVVAPLDDALVPPPDARRRLLVVVTATYNGRAPDSAVRTEQELDRGEPAAWKMPNTRYAVLGIGNSQWPNYQAFPKRIDAALEAGGAVRLLPRHEADGQWDFEGAVTGFVTDLWAALGKEASTPSGSGLTFRVSQSRSVRARVLPAHAQSLTVLENTEMVHPADGLWDFTIEAPRASTRHIRLALCEGSSYRTGDHVAVYARNQAALVDQALARLQLDSEDQVLIEGGTGRSIHLPLGQPVSARQLMTDFIELGGAAPRRALAVLAQHTQCPRSRDYLAALDVDWDTTAAKRLSLLDVLHGAPAVDLPVQVFVELSPAIAPRFYSAASSPLVSPRSVSLVVGTSASPAWSGQGQHQGFASTHMRNLEPGDTVFGYVRTPNPPFEPPTDPATPMILIGSGTGFAPFRGFLEERAAQQASGLAIGPSLLFFGCRHPDHDWLCREELEIWARLGVVTPILAYSAVTSHPWKYVQDAVWAERDRVWTQIEAGANIYLCGDGRHMAPAVRKVLIQTCMDRLQYDDEAGSKWLDRLIGTRQFRQDVFW